MLQRIVDDTLDSSALSAEKKLLLALLKRAVLDYCGTDAEESDRAERWLFGDLQLTVAERFTFPWVCEHLGFDSKGLAAQIRRAGSDGGEAELLRRCIPGAR